MFLPILTLKSTDQEVGLPARTVRSQGAINACFSCAMATGLEARLANLPALAPEYHFGVSSRGVVTAAGIELNKAMEVLASHGMASLLELKGIAETPVEAKIEAEYIQARYDTAMTRRGQERAVPLNGARAQRYFPRNIVYWTRYSLQRSVPVVLLIHIDSNYRLLDNSGRPEADHVVEWKELAGNRESQDHAVCAIGYQLNERKFVIQDSRGLTFGRGGQWLAGEDLLARVAIRGIGIEA